MSQDRPKALPRELGFDTTRFAAGLAQWNPTTSLGSGCAGPQRRLGKEAIQNSSVAGRALYFWVRRRRNGDKA